MKRLVWFRILLAWAAVTWVTFAFLGLSRTFPAKQQLIPALLMGNLLAVGVILIGTILLGRFYCSVICPLGIFQDGVSFISEKIRRKKNSFRYRKELRVLRYALLV
ncbi:MAG: 4Fe-4S binding protein, partial [Schwartzia sp.]|nr:4Fe-4S binding protein [Schwartzia sp. (in: firmicutes)]